MGFLDNTGVARLWQHILVKVNERLTVDPSIAEEGAANLINADSLGGVLAENYATKADIDAIDILVADPTLTQEGLAAESKTTGTRIAATENRITATENRITTIENNKVESINGLTGKDITLDVGTMGAVLKTGDTMTGWLYVPRLVVQGNDNYPAITYADLEGNIVGAMQFNANAHRAYLSQKASDTGYNEQYFFPTVSTGLQATQSYNILTTKNAVTVAQGGTGATTFTAGTVLIGNGTGAITTRAILDNNEVGPLGWQSSVRDNILTADTLAYWNGAYSGTTSNISVLGTISTGTWNGSTIGIAYGGTGATDVSNARKNLLVTSLKTTDAATTALVRGVQISELPSTANGTQDPQGGALLTAAVSNTRGMQIANGYSATSFKWRFIHTEQTSSAGTKGYSPWYTIYHSGNINTLMTEITNRLSNASGVSF